MEVIDQQAERGIEGAGVRLREDAAVRTFRQPSPRPTPAGEVKNDTATAWGPTTLAIFAALGYNKGVTP
jgi:hypothetical protein